jgi:hypothetical protein
MPIACMGLFCTNCYTCLAITISANSAIRITAAGLGGRLALRRSLGKSGAHGSAR